MSVDMKHGIIKESTDLQRREAKNEKSGLHRGRVKSRRKQKKEKKKKKVNKNEINETRRRRFPKCRNGRIYIQSVIYDSTSLWNRAQSDHDQAR